MNTTTDTSTPTPSAPPKPWSGFKYEQVPGLANRHIARWLRYQRRNMLRFFLANNLTDLADRLSRIRKSNKGMMEKNRAFQKVLDDYSKLVNPGAAPVAAAEADAVQVQGNGGVGVLRDADAPADADGGRGDDGSGVPGVEAQDGVVVEE